jgi:hypothetical protein
MRFLIIAFVIAFSTLRAQDSTIHKLIPGSSIKYSPLHLINFYPTIQVAYEQFITGRLTTQVDLGYVVKVDRSYDERFLNKKGVKVKIEPRIYFAPVLKRRLIYYSSVEGYYNRINFNRKSDREECFDLSCEHRYIRKYFYPVKYREYGLSLKMGFVKYYRNFMLDINSGWTLRIIDYQHGIFEPENFDDFFPIPNETDRIVPSPNLGVRVGYRVK